jgi:hypothetical protein
VKKDFTEKSLRGPLKMDMSMEKQDTEPPVNGRESTVVRMLLEERRRLLSEVGRIDRMLAREGLAVQPIHEEVGGVSATGSGRVRNSITKVDALLQVLRDAKKPLSQKELLLGIQELGYVFSSKNPSNTLNPLLYGDRKLPGVTKLPAGFVLSEREKEFIELKSESW